MILLLVLLFTIAYLLTAVADTQQIYHLPLYEKDNSHHVYIEFGSLRKQLFLIVDTGSALTSVLCQDPTTTNSKQHSYNNMNVFNQAFVKQRMYHPDQSETALYVPCGKCHYTNQCVHYSKNASRRRLCRLSTKYTEGSSWSGFEVLDYVTLSSSSIIPSSIGGVDISDLVEDDLIIVLEDEDATDDTVNNTTSSPVAVTRRLDSVPIIKTVDFVFACETYETGTFRTQYADGILGLGRQHSNILTTLRGSGVIKKKSFSVCLTKKGGLLTLGGSVAAHTNDASLMKYTPLEDNVTFYIVKVVSFYLGDHQLDTGTVASSFSNGKGTVVDSGTTDTFLPVAIAQPFREAWQERTGLEYTNEPQTMDFETFQSLPSIKIVLENDVEWIISPFEYFDVPSEWYDLWKDRNISNRVRGSTPPKKVNHHTVVSRIYLDEPNGAVLGANSMRNREVYFDLEENRIGIADVECSQYDRIESSSPI